LQISRDFDNLSSDLSPLPCEVAGLVRRDSSKGSLLMRDGGLRLDWKKENVRETIVYSSSSEEEKIG